MNHLVELISDCAVPYLCCLPILVLRSKLVCLIMICMCVVILDEWVLVPTWLLLASTIELSYISIVSLLSLMILHFTAKLYLFLLYLKSTLYNKSLVPSTLYNSSYHLSMYMEYLCPWKLQDGFIDRWGIRFSF